jgi:hypothetical protein
MSMNTPRLRHLEVLVAVTFSLAVVGCATSQSGESVNEKAAAEAASQSPEPTRYRLPIDADALGEGATVRAGLDGRLVVVADGNYWILSVDGVSEGGTAKQVDRGDWSAYRDGLDLEADSEVPEQVRDFAALAEAAGVTHRNATEPFRGEVGRGGDAACWRVSRNEGAWRAEPVGDGEPGDCTSRWLYTVTRTDGTHRFETYRGHSITYEGGIGLANQTYLLGLERVVQCNLQPRAMYGSSEIPEDRRLADDLSCGWDGGEVTFPVEGAQYVGFTEGFDGSLAATVRDADEGPVVYLVQ